MEHPLVQLVNLFLQTCATTSRLGCASLVGKARNRANAKKTRQQQGFGENEQLQLERPVPAISGCGLGTNQHTKSIQ